MFCSVALPVPGSANINTEVNMPRRGRIQVKVRVERKVRVTSRVQTGVGFLSPPDAEYGAVGPGADLGGVYCEVCGTWTPPPYVDYVGEFSCNGCDRAVGLEPD